MSDLSPDPAAEQLSSFLRQGERILWQGRPIREKFRWRMWPISCMGALFTLLPLAMSLFAVVVYTLGRARGMEFEWGPQLPLLLLVNLPFLVVGLVIVMAPAMYADRLWPSTEYALTDQRVLIRTGIKSPVLAATELREVSGITAKGSQVGNVVFQIPGAFAGPFAPFVFYRRGWNRYPVALAPTFEAIERPQELLRIAQSALQNAKEDR